jgi:hypothetical protein
MFFGSGSFSQRLGANTHPVGGRIMWVELDLAPGAIQQIDTEVDYRDRWFTLDSLIQNKLFYDPSNNGVFILPGPIGPLNGSNFNFPKEKNALVTTEAFGVFKGDVFYSAKGWDGSTPRTSLAIDQNFAQWYDRHTELFRNVFLYADQFTGGLSVRNNEADRYQGLLVMKITEQLNALIVTP